MCGIAGAIGLSRADTATCLERMVASLRHRGPDGEGTAVVTRGAEEPVVGLAQTRLAIIDLSSAGRQPMVDAEARVTLVYNGEIYNFRELRRELQGLGHAFRTDTDTEVVLRGYLEWGTSVVDRLAGMFAWALADERKGIVWLCRDRLGIKPLYVTRAPRGAVLFASELRSLLSVGDELVPRRLSLRAVEAFLAQGMVCGLASLVDGIELVAPGEWVCLGFDGRVVEKRQYWRLPFDDTRGGDRREAVERLSSTLRQAVAQHLISDVPLGVFLSGGIDSTAIAILAVESSKSPVSTLAVGFDDKRFDESRVAEETAKRLGTRHTTMTLSGGEVLASVDRVLASMDQPTVDGFNMYFVSRAAHESGLTVALSGLGGDELFGGYASFRDVPRAQRVARLARRLNRHGRLGSLLRLAWGRFGVKARELLKRRDEVASLYLLRRELFLTGDRRAFGPLPEGSDAETARH